ncbi:MAG: hypothetical protein JOY80_05310 [Candidatus Dormibacteraeota bacterium]|nr:hypothetical protein [Candidatus Dormibacteraeota bacterium]
MLLGATVLCFLIMLVLVADRLGSRVFHGDADRTFYRCEACDLRYPRHEIGDPRLRVCPVGHPIFPEQRRIAAGLIGIFVCLGFLAVAIALMLTGLVPR